DICSEPVRPGPPAHVPVPVHGPNCGELGHALHTPLPQSDTDVHEPPLATLALPMYMRVRRGYAGEPSVIGCAMRTTPPTNMSRLAVGSTSKIISTLMFTAPPMNSAVRPFTTRVSGELPPIESR